MTRSLERHELIGAPRQHCKVIPFRPAAAVVFDQDGGKVLDDFVMVPKVAAQHIASLLVQAAPHLRSRRAVDEAVLLLTGHPSARRTGRDRQGSEG